MKISVIIAAYNGAEYIEEQIDSIVKQTKRVDEIIVCDDNSSDNTYELLYKIKENIDVELSIIKHTENMGVKKTFYELIRKADGDIVFLSDQDDFWYRTKVEEMVGVMQEGINVVLSDADIVNSNLEKSGVTLWQCLGIDAKKYKLDEKYLEREMIKRNIFTGMNMCFRKSITDGIEFRIDMYHDEFIGWMGIFTKSVKLINKRLAAYRQHGGNVVGVNKRTKFQSFFQMYRTIKKSTKRKYRNLRWTRKYLSSEYERQVELFYKERIRVYHRKSILYFARVLFLGGLYKKYKMYTCSKEKALLKDAFCVCYGRFFST